MARIVLWLAIATGCEGAMTPASPSVVGDDFGGRSVPPTATLTVVFSAPLDAAPSIDPDAVTLVRGEVDAALVRGLEHPPLSTRERERLVAVTLEAHARELRVAPRRPLAADSRYTLALSPRLRIGGSQLGRVVERAFVTSGAEQAAPTLALIDPADGETDVARDLRTVELRYSRPVRGGDAVTLEADDGSAVPAVASVGSCAACVHLELLAALAAEKRYYVQAAPSVADDEGRPLFGDPPSFRTGTIATSPPIAVRALETWTADRCLSARFSTDGPTRAELCVAQVCARGEVAPTHVLAVRAAPPWRYVVRAWDRSTAPMAHVGPTPFDPPPDATVAITEILFHPFGLARGQQFVELENFGTTSVELRGWSLHDSAGENALPTVTLPPGGFALVVSAQFLTDDGADPVPPPSARLVRVAERHLGGAGLDPAGGPIWIEDQAGRVVTRFGGYPIDLVRGQSVERARADSCDVAASFRATPSGGATPGS